MHVSEHEYVGGQADKRLQHRVLHDLIWDLQPQLHEKGIRICCRSQFSELKIICDAANVSACSIGSLIGHSVDIVGESPDETSLSRFTCDFDSAKPESAKTTNEALYNRTENRIYCRVISATFGSP